MRVARGRSGLQVVTSAPDREHAHGKSCEDPDVMDKQVNTTNGIAKTLLIISISGALSWGLVGFFNFNLVHAIFGGAAMEQPTTASRVVYVIVGLCGLGSLFLLPKIHAEPVHTGRLANRTA